MSGTVEVLAGAPALAEAAADRLAAWLEAALRARGTASLAVSGGATPVLTHRALARRPLDWSRVHVWFCDERAVGPDDPDSNHRLARDTLIAPAGIPDANVHRMIGEAPDLDAEAERYARALPAALDVLLLGIGPDGHTCSLFPGSPLVTERVRRVAAVFDSPKPPPRRITLTPPTLAAAGDALMLVEGQEKADAVARALDPVTAPQQVPASLVRGRTWLLDTTAAARLPAARVARPAGTRTGAARTDRAGEDGSAVRPSRGGGDGGAARPRRSCPAPGRDSCSLPGARSTAGSLAPSAAPST